MKLQIRPWLMTMALGAAVSILNGCSTPPKTPISLPAAPIFQPATWAQMPGWGSDDIKHAWPAFLASCQTLRRQPAWQPACAAAAALPDPDDQTLRAFFQQYFDPYQLTNPDGSPNGLITGYYEPQLHGSLKRTGPYQYPVYGVPQDLLTVDLGAVYPELKNMRLRGRLDGKRVVPYYDRADIEAGKAPLKGNELCWVNDPLDLFFLQIQGSGRIKLTDGETLRVGYADQNGYPYRSIGKYLVEHGEMTADQASMEGIKSWARAHPDKLTDLLNYNASYVFFRVLPNNDQGPIGAQGVPLTARRSLAVDKTVIPLGAPIFLSTTWPNSDKPLNRLMVAQDTGGAIRGRVRADFYWGYGPDAGALAGAMRQSGKLWVLLPKDSSNAKPDSKSD